LESKDQETQRTSWFFSDDRKDIFLCHRSSNDVSNCLLEIFPNDFDFSSVGFSTWMDIFSQNEYIESDLIKKLCFQAAVLKNFSLLLTQKESFYNFFFFFV